MKSIAFLILIFISELKVYAQTVDSRGKFEQRMGIEDIILKSSMSKFRDLEFVSKYGKCQKLYKRKNGIFKVGELEVKSVQYLFEDDKLTGIIFYLNKQDDYTKLWSEIEKYYGQPEGPDMTSEGNQIIGNPGHYTLNTKSLNIYIILDQLMFGFYSSRIIDCERK